MKSDGAPDKNRTCGLQLRRLSLYPTELRARNHALIFILSHSVKLFEFAVNIAFINFLLPESALLGYDSAFGYVYGSA